MSEQPEKLATPPPGRALDVMPPKDPAGQRSLPANCWPIPSPSSTGGGFRYYSMNCLGDIYTAALGVLDTAPNSDGIVEGCNVVVHGIALASRSLQIRAIDSAPSYIEGMSPLFYIASVGAPVLFVQRPLTDAAILAALMPILRSRALHHLAPTVFRNLSPI